jgi:hypothetical protein
LSSPRAHPRLAPNSRASQDHGMDEGDIVMAASIIAACRQRAVAPA